MCGFEPRRRLQNCCGVDIRYFDHCRPAKTRTSTVPSTSQGSYRIVVLRCPRNAVTGVRFTLRAPTQKSLIHTLTKEVDKSDKPYTLKIEPVADDTLPTPINKYTHAGVAHWLSTALPTQRRKSQGSSILPTRSKIESKQRRTRLAPVGARACRHPDTIATGTSTPSNNRAGSLMVKHRADNSESEGSIPSPPTKHTGHGAARGGRLHGMQNTSRVRFPDAPPNMGQVGQSSGKRKRPGASRDRPPLDPPRC